MCLPRCRGDEPGARHHRHGVRPSGAGAQFQSRTLSAELLWSPLPQGWDMSAPLPSAVRRTLTIPHTVLERRAVLTLQDGGPFSLVLETYTSKMIDFRKPPPSDAARQ